MKATIGGVEVTIDKGSYYKIELMKEEYIHLSFKHPSLLSLPVGTTATAGGFTGVLTENYAPTYNQARSCYEYNVQFKAPYWAKNNTLVKLNVNGDFGPIFDITDTPAHILAQIAASAGWTVGTCMPTEVVVMHFEGTHCVDALNQLCQACDPNGFYEWWFNGNTVNIGKLGAGVSATVALSEENVSGISASRDSAPPITKLYAYGSDKNLNARYGKTFTFNTMHDVVNIITDYGQGLGAGYFDPLHIVTSKMFKQSARITEQRVARSITPQYPIPFFQIPPEGYSYEAPLIRILDDLSQMHVYSWQDTPASLRFNTSVPFKINVRITKLREKTEKKVTLSDNLKKLKVAVEETDDKAEQLGTDVKDTQRRIAELEGEISALGTRVAAIEQREPSEDSGISVASATPDPGGDSGSNDGDRPDRDPSEGGGGGGGSRPTGTIGDPVEIEFDDEFEDVAFDGVSLKGSITLVAIDTNGTEERIPIVSSEVVVLTEQDSEVGVEWQTDTNIPLPERFEFKAKKGFKYSMEVAISNVKTPNTEDYLVKAYMSNPESALYFEDQNIIDAGTFKFNPWGFPEDDERSRVFSGQFMGMPDNIIAGRCPTSWFTAPSDYAGYIVSGSPRLRLPEGAIGTGDVEGMIIFDDIYPSMSGTLGSDLAYDAFEEKDEENLPTGRWLKYYSFTTSLLPSTLSSDDLTGETMHIVFTSGRLNGMDFELKIMGNASGVCKLCIIPNEDYSALVPNDTLAPETGDTYKLYNVDACLYMEGDPIGDAEARLRAAAQTYLDRQLEDTGIYNCSIKPTKAAALKDTTFGAGASLSFGGASLESTRVIGIKRFLDLPEAGLEIMVGNSTPYRKLDYIEKKVTVG